MRTNDEVIRLGDVREELKEVFGTMDALLTEITDVADYAHTETRKLIDQNGDAITERVALLEDRLDRFERDIHSKLDELIGYCSSLNKARG